MSAYEHEYDFIKREGVAFRFLSQPIRVVSKDGKVVGLECLRVALGDPDDSGRPTPIVVPGSEFTIPADQIVRAIGQKKPKIAELLGLEVVDGYIKVSDEFETSLPGVFAGGDCIRARGTASTVMAVQDGKMAAQAIHRRLMGVPS
jgi:dihydropyrimidine dehydrogenase (NAD+) subunit PreT